MERRERYDPEDIESLLSERSFDALLDEERVFVLRHLSGREEYERMRALLLYVRPDERSRRDDLEPEERIRQHVLVTFRAQQKPQWRIWLNTLATWASPADMTQLWRPALAFGSLAVLVVAGYVAVETFNADKASGLAELEKLPGRETPELTALDTAKSDNTTEREAEVESAEPSQKKKQEGPTPTASGGSTLSESPEESKDVGYLSAARESDALTEDQVLFVPSATATMTADDLAKEEGQLERSATTFSHVVTAEELVRNQSTSNISGIEKAITAKRSKQSERTATNLAESRSVAADPGIMGLLAAGW